MKHITKKVLSILLSVMLLLSVSGITAFAASASTMSVTLRIEGIHANMFYKTMEVPYTDSLTLQTALQYIDAQESGITITGVDSGYITDINGDTSGKFGGYDGWLFRVNGVEPSVSISGYTLKNNDSVVLYYGDPYGVGMQYPVADTSHIADGVIKFTSSDTTYDADYNPTVTVNPVAEATITWYYGNTSATYTTNANGEITIDAAQLTAGAHIVQIAKTNDAGIPLVLRFASDYSVAVADNNSQDQTTATVTTTQAETSNPGTGDKDNTAVYYVIVSITMFFLVSVIGKGRKLSYEK